MAPPALGRTFTIRQFARLVDQIEPITAADPVELGLQLVDDAKFARGMMQPVPVEQDDVADPMGRPLPSSASVLTNSTTPSGGSCGRCICPHRSTADREPQLRRHRHRPGGHRRDRATTD